MNRVLCSVSLTFLLFACAAEERSAAPPAARPVNAAKNVVAELYRDHDAQRGPFFQTDSKPLVEKYFEASLAELIWKDVVDAKDGVGALASAVAGSWLLVARGFSFQAPRSASVAQARTREQPVTNNQSTAKRDVYQPKGEA